MVPELKRAIQPKRKQFETYYSTIQNVKSKIFFFVAPSKLLLAILKGVLDWPE